MLKYSENMIDNPKIIDAYMFFFSVNLIAYARGPEMFASPPIKHSIATEKQKENLPGEITIVGSKNKQNNNSNVAIPKHIRAFL
mmetsp:Transcript_29992/g.21746  ORF Transcript_29992/g.21746 Transcript_29992/m.21746 type:complete len:84 (+) Transcript_29992:205-456(+)